MNKSIPLTASEFGQLWRAYQSETMSFCMLQYFHKITNDEQAKTLIQQMMDAETSHNEMMQQIFKQEGIPVPIGFTSEDVNPNAPRLFTDGFIMQYIDFMNWGAMEESQIGLAISANSEIRDFFTRRLHEFIRLENTSIELLLEKGLWVRAPYVPYPKQVEFVKETSWLSGFFGEKRPLNVIEVQQLFLNAIRNALGEVLMTAFSQTAKSREIREYMARGKEMSKEFINIFNAALQRDDFLPTSLNDLGVTDATEAPFSDKLMLGHITALNALAIGFYGASAAQLSRKDIAAQLAVMTAKTAVYAEEGANLLIKFGFMEQPPTAPDRENLPR